MKLDLDTAHEIAMTRNLTSQSPVHHLLAAYDARWVQIGEAAVAARCGSAEAEQAAMRVLGLCDVSGLAKLGVKGPAAETWLTGQQVEPPAAVYDSRPLADGGLIVRLGADEFLLESGIACQVVPALSALLDPGRQDLYRVERQDATFLLSGSRSMEVLAQTCAINPHQTQPNRLALTQVAGVSCGVLPQTSGDVPVYRLWVDPSYAAYLWQMLLEIGESLGGRVVGAACFYPELARD